MKLAIVGADGWLGLHVARLARAGGLDVFPVTGGHQSHEALEGIFSFGETRYASYDSFKAMKVALDGATHVVASLEPRGRGQGLPRIPPRAASILVDAAREASVGKLLYVSVMGAFRWSTHALNRHAYWMERALTRRPGPWAVLRLSCYHQELVDAHVRPPDGRVPRPIPRNGRYSPISGEDAARLILAALPRIPVGRLQAVGGPAVYGSAQLSRLTSGLVSRGLGLPTAYRALPRGDVSVSPQETLAACGVLPEDTIESLLESLSAWKARPETAPRVPTVYPAEPPGPSTLDSGEPVPVLQECSPALRRVVHQQLGDDLARRGLDVARLDFSGARPGSRRVRVHGGFITDMDGVRALDARGDLVHQGSVEWLRDELGEVFHVFFGDQIPAALWRELDMGVRRRLVKDPRWSRDPRVRSWSRRQE